MQTRIHTRSITRLALGSHRQCIIQELKVASVCLFPISRLEGLWEFKKRIQSTALADDKITQVRRKGRNKMKRIDLKHGFDNIKAVVEEKYAEFEMNNGG